MHTLPLSSFLAGRSFTRGTYDSCVPMAGSNNCIEVEETAHSVEWDAATNKFWDLVTGKQRVCKHRIGMYPLACRSTDHCLRFALHQKVSIE